MVVRMLNSIKKDIQIIKKNQSEVKVIISEKKNALEELNSRLGEAEDGISYLEDKIEEIPNQNSIKEKRIKKNEDSLSDHLENMQHNIFIIGMPEGKRVRKR